MIKRITRIGVHRAGVVLGWVGAAFTLPLSIFALAALLAGESGRGAVTALLMPIMYLVLGYICGVLFAWIYNLLVNLTGGFEFELSDAEPKDTPS